MLPRTRLTTKHNQPNETNSKIKCETKSLSSVSQQFWA
jgi:hypothetical protein